MKSILANKRILALAVALVILVASSVGGTIAWFTDTVNSGSNIIKSGKLDVEMYYADGSAAVPTSEDGVWKDASEGAIFNYDKWEPGYTEARHIKIENKGNLAFKYQLNINTAYPVDPNAIADVIDVYYIYPAQQITDRSVLTDENCVGTLRDMTTDPDGAVYGALLPTGTTEEEANGQPVGEVSATIALKMRESAGNEYQGMSLADDITVQLFATQLAFEEDSFGSNYDANLTEPLPQVSTAAELTSYISSGKSAALSEDITLNNEDSSILINSDVESTIDLAGNKLTIDSSAAVGVATGTLNLVNSNSDDEDSNAKIVIGNSSQGLGAVGSGIINIGEGVVVETGSGEWNLCALDGGTINMTEGSIVANGAPAFTVSGGSFNMSGGKITVEKGGAVAVYKDSTVNMSGGTIEVKNGSGIVTDAGSTSVKINMTGGEIILNAPTTTEGETATYNFGISTHTNKSNPTVSLTGGKITVKGAGAYGLNLSYSNANVTLSSPFSFDIQEGGNATITTGGNNLTITDNNNILNNSSSNE